MGMWDLPFTINPVSVDDRWKNCPAISHKAKTSLLRKISEGPHIQSGFRRLADPR